jgi:hypothetical protein
MKYLPTHIKRMFYAAQDGYAILFAVIMIGIILALSVGLSDIAYKQLVISSVASDSQLAFYQSDTATECALYQDFVNNAFPASTPPSPVPPAQVSCGVDSTGNNYALNMSYAPSPDGTSEVYTLAPLDPTSLAPCFIITTTRNTTSGATKIAAQGYNICNKTNARTVEREIDASF